MAEEDDAQKTEDPTEKKLGKARQKGQVAQSMEIKTWGVLFAGGIGLMFMARHIADGLRLNVQRFIEAPDLIPADFDHLLLVIADLSWNVAIILSPLMVLLVVAAVIGNVGQFGLLFATEKVKPDINKLSLVTGFKRMFGTRAVVEFLKGILKIVIVSVVAFGVSLPLLQDVELFPAMEMVAILDRIVELAIHLLVGALAALTVIAAIDFMYQKYMFMKQMRMSKQEVKDEQKESEGDPHVRAKIRKLRMERAQQRMMAAVPEADVVITNPTHFAVALEYKMEQMTAPRLVVSMT